MTSDLRRLSVDPTLEKIVFSIRTIRTFQKLIWKPRSYSVRRHGKLGENNDLESICTLKNTGENSDLMDITHGFNG